MGAFADDELDFDGAGDTQASVAVAKPVQVTEAVEPGTGKTEGEGEGETPVEGVDPEVAKAEAEKAAAKEKARVEREGKLREFEELAERVAQDDGSSGREPATGTLSEAQVAEVLAKYRELDLPGKRAAAKHLQEKMTEFMRSGASGQADDMQVAVSYLELSTAVSNSAKTKETVTREPVDPTVAFVDHVTTLFIAPQLAIVPDGVAEDWEARVQDKAAELADNIAKYREWYTASAETRGDAPEVSPLVVQAANLAAGRSVKKAGGGTRKASSTPRASVPSDGVRRDIGRHIAEYFAAQPIGHIASLSEVANFDSTEYAPGKPSQGAIAARFFAKDEDGNLIIKEPFTWAEGLDGEELPDGTKRPKSIKKIGEVELPEKASE